MATPNLDIEARRILQSEDATDRVVLRSLEESNFIDNLCMDNLDTNDYFNFLCGELPLPHIEIGWTNESITQSIEIMVVGEGKIKLNFTDNTEMQPVGCAKIISTAYNMNLSGFLVKSKENGIALMNNTQLTEEQKGIAGDVFAGFLTNYIGIQMALLHPDVRDVFRVKSTPVDEDGKALSKKASKRRRIARYVKVRTIDYKKLNDVQNKRSFTRKCKAWFVLGHWRQYSNGKRVFIQGYWKGPLRDTKRNADEIRIRQIV